jgi:hypothetical protein
MSSLLDTMSSAVIGGMDVITLNGLIFYLRNSATRTSLELESTSPLGMISRSKRDPIFAYAKWEAAIKPRNPR